ncbi:hypothetical protein EP10_001933 [Geobacillus icigianus]|uniref:Uncharacterized protein n=1 Tax=Geobacillus icigianus TaxID=1430331 RepID=A0ABU6BGM7_9BACL|nr:hypothetical protein [Geobacillus icigianus]
MLSISHQKAVAIPNQMQPISKIRIFKPKKAKDGVFKLTSEQMDLIDEKICRMYTKLREDPENRS